VEAVGCKRDRFSDLTGNEFDKKEEEGHAEHR
jgi:hypothetical protein